MSSTITVHQARPTRQRKPTYFRPKPTARGARAITRINAGSRVIPRISALGRMSANEDEPSGAQRWLSMVDETEEEEEYEDLLLEIVPETNEYIASIEDALNFVSVMGPTRSGKSTLMNLLAECKEKELFPTAGGGISFTKGIDIGNKIMSVEEFSKADGGQEVTPIVPGQQVAFLDTEGQGDQGDNYDISLFTPAILCSRIVIFNTKEVAKDYLLTQLALMTTIAQRITLDEEEDEENPGPKFGQLMIVINQYTLGDSVEIVKQNILGQETGSSPAVKRRNEIRVMLYTQFEDISLHILRGNQLKPGVEEDLESGVKKFLLLSDFLPVYVTEFLILRSVFAEKLRHPRIVARESMSGQSVAGLVPSIVDAINSEDPLDIPDLWEQTQNAAILKASLVFRDAFRASCDAVLQSPDLFPTVQVASLLGSKADHLLHDMEKALSYIPLAKIIATRAILSEEALLGKQHTLELNLVRIKSESQIKLAELISALPQHLTNEFPSLLVSNATAMTRIEQLKARLFEQYKSWVIGYDPAGYPEGYHGKFDTAYQYELMMMLEIIKLGWIQWVVTKDEEALQPVKIALDKLTAETAIGDLVKWKRGAEDLRVDTLLKYNGVIDASYLWTDPAAVKEGFVIKLTEIIAVSEENFKKDEESVKKFIDAALAVQIQSYQNHLLTALPPRKEPGDYATIINPAVYRTLLQVMMATSNISEGLTQQYLLSFDTQTAVMINKFSAEYTKASTDFITYLEAQLTVLVPHRVGDFQLLADRITIHKDLAKTALRSELDSHSNTVLVAFDSDIRVFEITQDAGRIRVEAARRDLSEQIEGHRGTKLALLKDAVSDWNRQKLNIDTRPVLTGVVDYSIDTSAKLTTAIARARTDFWSHASGDEADRVEGWSSFESQTVGLYENVRRASALFIGKVNATDGATAAMEKIVMSKIMGNVANTANMLGMSWVSSGREFLVETNESGGKNGRSHIYKNQPVRDQGEGWDKPTSLKFHTWRVEFSEFQFDDPIIQELEPFQINSYTPPLSEADTIVDVTFAQTQSETVTNTNTTMFKFDVEHSASAGLPGVASATVKTTFGGSGTFTDTKANEIGFSINFKTPVTCPANRLSVINHLGFKQKMSMTYTAKVKIVPSVLFTGGFTVWGGGPYTDPKNTRPNYHKQHTGNRFYDPIENGFSDQFKEKAAADTTPWAWRACIGRHSQVQGYVNGLNASGQYELYVRGKWEGVHGWKHVITRSISVPGMKSV